MPGPEVKSTIAVTTDELHRAVVYMPVLADGHPVDREDARHCHAWVVDKEYHREGLLYSPMDWGTRAFLMLPDRGIFVSFWDTVPYLFGSAENLDYNRRLIRQPDLDLREVPNIVATPQRAVYVNAERG